MIAGVENDNITNMHQRDRTKPFPLLDNVYTYDLNGNRTSKQTLTGLTTYAYDSVNRLVTVNSPTTEEQYHYDKAGNRIEKLINGITTECYHYNARNHLIGHDIFSRFRDTVMNNSGLLFYLKIKVLAKNIKMP